MDKHDTIGEIIPNITARVYLAGKGFQLNLFLGTSKGPAAIIHGNFKETYEEENIENAVINAFDFALRKLEVQQKHVLKPK